MTAAGIGWNCIAREQSAHISSTCRPGDAGGLGGARTPVPEECPGLSNREHQYPREPTTHAGDQAEFPLRLGAACRALALGTIGSVGMWSFVVALPAVQADFGVARGEASLPYTLTMVGFGVGGIVMGRLADRFGIVLPVLLGGIALGVGYMLTGVSANLWQLALAQGLLGLGSAATFGPLMTDTSYWFVRRRGIAVAIASCGNYLSGVIWPPIIQHFIASNGWRPTQIVIGLICVVTIVPLALVLRRRRRSMRTASMPRTPAAAVAARSACRPTR